MMAVMVTPDGYVLGGSLVAVAVVLVALLVRESLVRACRWLVYRRRQAHEVLLRRGRGRHRPGLVRPAAAHRPARVVRPSLLPPPAVAPRPRVPVEQTRVMPAWNGSARQYPELGDRFVPRQRGGGW